MNSRAPILAVVAVTAIVAGIAAGTYKWTPAAPEAGTLPSLLTRSFPDATGKMQPLSQWKGRALVINFWATWCAPCVKEMPELDAIQHSLDQNKVQILGIGIDSAHNITTFAAKHKIGYPLYVAGNEGIALARDLGNLAGGLPFTVLIAADGTIRKTYLGVKLEELRQDLAAL
jgi:peroxiredoxin